VRHAISSRKGRRRHRLQPRRGTFIAAALGEAGATVYVTGRSTRRGKHTDAMPRRRGLIVSTVAWDRDVYIGGLYDVSKHVIVGMIWGLAKELRRHRIAALAVAPGFMRTERVLAAGRTDESGWKKIPGLRKTESPEYVGRVVAALVRDPNVLRRTGRTFRAGDLARSYGVTDVDGRRVPPFSVPKSFEKPMEDWESPPRARN
jgi:hypothetical protein